MPRCEGEGTVNGTAVLVGAFGNYEAVVVGGSVRAQVIVIPVSRMATGATLGGWAYQRSRCVENRENLLVAYP